MLGKRCLCLLLGLLCLAAAAMAGEEPTVEDLFATVTVEWDEQIAGAHNLLLPRIAGHPDPAVQEEINTQITEGLPVEQLTIAFDRAQALEDEEPLENGLQMQGSAFQRENILSIVLSVRGMWDDPLIRQRYYTFNFDLQSGQPITLSSLMEAPETAFSQMEQIITRETEKEDFNAYLENTQVLPMPRDQFSLDAHALTVYYSASQYSMISGTSGAFRFLYYEIESLLSLENPVTEILTELILRPEDPAAQVFRDIEAGQLPGIPAQIGQELQAYLDAYQVLREPDITLLERLYQFESPLMQQTWLGSEVYLDEGAAPTVISIRTEQLDLYGLRPGVSTLEDVVLMLGDPDARQTLDENGSFDMLLPVGESYYYHGESGRSLEFHADETGTVHSVILHHQVPDGL